MRDRWVAVIDIASRCVQLEDTGSQREYRPQNSPVFGERQSQITVRTIILFGPVIPSIESVEEVRRCLLVSYD
jgi:hypothetical protein